ncbi:MAG: CSLREA domain-containing protein, partial [Chloroflexota bacterium]
ITYATTITVNNPADTVADDGFCTLREAIIASNIDSASGLTPGECPAGAGLDVIALPANTYFLTIAGPDENAAATGDLDILQSVSLVGAGAASTVIDISGIDRVFHVIGPVTVSLSGATIRNGTVSSTVSPTSNAGGAVLLEGGASLSIVDSRFANNTAYSGGAIYNFSSGALSIARTAFSGNTGINSAGALYNDGSVLTLDNSTVSGNTGGLGAGGISTNGGGTTTIVNSTISGNIAPSGPGGGVYNDGGSSLVVKSSTINGNSGSPGGGIANVSGTVSLKNTIVANSLSGGACSGATASAGHNLASDGSCNLTGSGDLPNTNPLLGPLQNNGGSTSTHALLTGSPALDTGSSDCPPPSTDQRGVPRPIDGDGDLVAVCDIGAFEFLQVLGAVIDIKPGSDPNSVRLSERGVVAVAILTDGSVDATTVNPTTVCFGDPDHPSQRDCTEAHGRAHLEDANGDSRLDMVLHFEVQQTGIDLGDTQGCLTGTIGSQQIAACDSVRTLP